MSVKAYIEGLHRGAVLIQYSFRTKNIKTDSQVEIRAGQEFHGWTFEDLKEHGPGAIEVPKPAP